MQEAEASFSSSGMSPVAVVLTADIYGLTGNEEIPTAVRKAVSQVQSRGIGLDSHSLRPAAHLLALLKQAWTRQNSNQERNT